MNPMSNERKTADPLELKVIELVGKIVMYSRHNMWKAIETDILKLARYERNAALDEVVELITKLRMDNLTEDCNPLSVLVELQKKVIALKDKLSTHTSTDTWAAVVGMKEALEYVAEYFAIQDVGTPAKSSTSVVACEKMERSVKEALTLARTRLGLK